MNHSETPQQEITPDDVLEALRTVRDPELGKDLVSLGMVKKIDIAQGLVKLQIELTTPACPLKEIINRDVEAALARHAGFRGLEIDFTAQVTEGRKTPRQQHPAASEAEEPLAPGVKNIIGIASGKGGVGKSTVALNLAIALARSGAKVGLLDADIHGPNIPTMMGLKNTRPRVQDDKIVPLERFGVKMISMGVLVDESQPVVWRGPMMHSAMKQFFGDVGWGDLDYLIVDLPPGTGDVQLSLVQLVQVTGCVIVTTPQTVSLEDARKGLAMFQMTNTPVLGIIENMSYFICDGCGTRHNIFDTGGGERVARELELPFLGAIPLGLNVREGGDKGVPVTDSDPDCEQSRKFGEIARNLAARISVLNLEGAGAGELEIKLGRR
jgi:ATP-binding protein involved in chromosome partitioning